MISWKFRVFISSWCQFIIYVTLNIFNWHTVNPFYLLKMDCPASNSWCWKYFYWWSTYIYKICTEKLLKESKLNKTSIPDNWIKNTVLVISQINLKKHWSQSFEKLFLILPWYAIYCNICVYVHFLTTWWYCFSLYVV